MKYGYLKTKGFWEAAALRAIWTFAESFLAIEASSRLIEDINWHVTVSAALAAAFFSVLKSIVVGVPEA